VTKVLITGANGFIGSHLTRQLVKEKFEVFATKRNNSNLIRCNDYAESIQWINTDQKDWTDKVKQIKPQILIHTAWDGVSVKDRNNWELQLLNFSFSKQLFGSVLFDNDCKIIVLGSQAEYGAYSGRISEDYLPQPADAYGSIKLLTLHYLQSIEKEGEPWCWLRIFSVFGPGENQSWLIPQVIKHLTNNESIDLTKGEQSYDYLYIEDFVLNFMKLFYLENKKFGIYNFCSGKAIKIKELLVLIAKALGKSENLLNFGAIPYRQVQSMYMEGDNTKFCETFGKLSLKNVEQSIRDYIANIKKNNQ